MLPRCQLENITLFSGYYVYYKVRYHSHLISASTLWEAIILFWMFWCYILLYCLILGVLGTVCGSLLYADGTE